MKKSEKSAVRKYAVKYIPFVLCWVLFVLAIGISLS